MRASDGASSVPDALVAEGRLGVALGEPVEHARAELEAAVAEVCASEPGAGHLVGRAVRAVHDGPGDVRQAHAPDESVPVQEVVDVTRTLVLLLATACGRAVPAADR